MRVCCSSLILVGAVAVLLCGCGEERPPNEAVAKIAKTFGLYPKFAAQVRQATNMVLYEGLPHAGWEHETFTRELTNHRTVLFDDYTFYAEPVPVKSADIEALRSLYCDPKSFVPFRGFAACGGYHPDYALEWTVQGIRLQVQICFGCHEMKTFANGKELYCGVTDGALEKFKATLKPHRTRRPKPPRGE